MSATIDIVRRKDETNSRNEAPLYVRIIKNRKVHYIATGHRLESDFWDEKRRKVMSNHPNSVRLNNSLDTLKVKYQDEILLEEKKNIAI